MTQGVGILEGHLGHSFKNAALLQDALTHPSSLAPRTRKKAGITAGAAYERLEFLGDRVLGLVVAEWLYAEYPTASEGELAKRHAALVNRDALRAVAMKIDLSHHIRLAKGEEAEDARKNRAILSDGMEAVIGALYLDGGLDVARRFIKAYWAQDVAVEAAPADAKTRLQEWAQGRGLALPAYRVVESSGPPHAPKFVIEVAVKGYPAMRAEGHSKRAAEKAAATLILKVIEA